MSDKITIKANLATGLIKAWEYYTLPEHITQWNFAHPSWHCPSASNDLRPGGKFVARMEARDGSFGFDFEGTYTLVVEGRTFSYELADGRQVVVTFDEKSDHTGVVVSFDPEYENPVEMQRDGWQAILDNFKHYTESN